MSTALLERPMAKRNDVAVKIDAEVIAEAKMVAASRETTLADYLSELIRPLVRRDLQAETDKRLSGPSDRPDGGKAKRGKT